MIFLLCVIIVDLSLIAVGLFRCADALHAMAKGQRRRERSVER